MNKLWIVYVLFLVQFVSCEFSSIDGFGNNIDNPNWVASGAPLQRTTPTTSYIDEYSSVNVEESPREISNSIFGRPMRSQSNFTILHAAWGKFLEYDLIYTKNNENERLPISVPTGDKWFDPSGTGNKELQYFRQLSDNSAVRNIFNFATGVIDGSVIYGTSNETLNIIRDGPYLKTQAALNGESILPFNTDNLLELENNSDKYLNSDLFLTADPRGNENILLTSLITLFVREHNRVVLELSNDNNYESTEDLFNEARKRVIATIQAITFNEYFPIILEEESLGEYNGYDPTVNPQPTIQFGGLFKFQDCLYKNDITFRADLDESTVSIGDSFYDPSYIYELGVDGFLLGAAFSNEYAVSANLIDSLRNSLFNPPELGGSDLISLLIQHSRDFGVPYYNDLLLYYNLTPLTDFQSFNSTDPSLPTLFSEVYSSPDAADSLVLALAEARNGRYSGDLLRAVIKEQALALRDGDRFYYKNIDDFSPTEKRKFDVTTISDVILRNTAIEEFPCSGFTTNQVNYGDCELGKPLIDDLLEDYDHTYYTLNNQIILSWTSKEKEVEFQLIGKTKGWVGFAITNTPGNMLYSDAVIGAFIPYNSYLGDYFISRNREVNCPGVCTDREQGGKFDLRHTSVSQTTEYTILRWIRYKDTGDSKDIEIEDKMQDVIFAMSANDQDELSYHYQNAIAGRINFATGEFDESSYDGAQSRLIIHGTFMYFAWVFLFPLGTMVVRFWKKFLKRWWFRSHMLIQYLGVLFIIVALIISVEAVADQNKPHIATAHSILGVISVSLSIVTPAFGQITSLLWNAERKKVPIFPDKIHYFLGYASPIIGYVTIFFGLKERHAAWFFYLLCGLGILGILIIFIAFEIYNRVNTALTAKKNAERNANIAKEEAEDEKWSDEEEAWSEE